MRKDVELRHITKSFDVGSAAVDDLSLEIEQGELVSLLGPSGCGKTTTLRIVGGFVSPDRGRVLLKGTDITDLPPNKRDVGMVFQSYALFPHMTVATNVGYGLRMRHVNTPELRRRVEEALELVRLGAFAGRYPAQLSGGQQQRVALARAIVIRPSVLLLDEPLSNLDAKLRQGMRFEIRQLQRKLGITTVFVTHDQEEALTLSDRVAVMDQGRIVQLGAPRDIYRHPSSRFVADFIGEANLISATVTSTSDNLTSLVTVGTRQDYLCADHGPAVGSSVILAVRPENVRVLAAGSTGDGFENRALGVVEEKTYLGASTSIRVRLDEGTIVHARLQNLEGATHEAELPAEMGDRVMVCWHASACRLITAP